jgi:hypothetical protein
VKTTNGSARTPFYLTRNERELAAERPRDWHREPPAELAAESHISRPYSSAIAA